MAATKMHLKIQLLPSNELRRMELPATYERLVERVNELLSSSAASYALFYYDDEDELIRLSTEAEYQLAIELAASKSGMIVRMVARPFPDEPASQQQQQHQHQHRQRHLHRRPAAFCSIASSSLADGTRVKPRASLRKTWTVTNQSQTELPAGYALSLVKGFRSAQLGLPRSIPLSREPLAAGDAVTVAVDFTAPDTDGAYLAIFHLVDPKSRKTRIKCWVLICVDSTLQNAESMENSNSVWPLVDSTTGIGFGPSHSPNRPPRLEFASLARLLETRSISMRHRYKHIFLVADGDIDVLLARIAEIQALKGLAKEGATSSSSSSSESSDREPAKKDGSHHHHHHHHHHGRHHRHHGNRRHTRKKGESVLQEADIPEKAYVKLTALGFADRSVTTPLLLQYGGRVKKVARVLSGVSTDG